MACGPAHIARAALEGIAWRVADIVEAMSAQAPVEALRVDGGLTNDQTLLQVQADAWASRWRVGRADTTVLGAAMLAAVGAGAVRERRARRARCWAGADRRARLRSASARRRGAGAFVERASALAPPRAARPPAGQPSRAS